MTPKRLILELTGLRERDLARAVPLALAYGVILASLYVLKPARNALFLSQAGADRLPLVLVLVAVVGGFTVGIVGRLAGTQRIDRLVQITLAFLATNLVGFWWLLPGDTTWKVFAFYVWVNLYGHVAASFMWLLANAAFDAREARRVFGFIGAAGILGSVVGGGFTRQAVPVLGTENLLLVCVGLIGVCVLAIRRVDLLPSGPAPSRRIRSQQRASIVLLIGESRLLRVLAPMAGLTAVVSAIADIQFNTIVEQSLTSQDERTAFFGTFFACLNVGAFLLQLLVTSRLMKRYGLGVVLAVLPLLLALGSAALFLLPGLLTGVLLKASDGGLRHSINKAGVEVLFVPIPDAVKQRAKLFLDATVDNLGTGIGALLVLGMTMGLGLEFQHASLLSIGAVVAWLFLVARARSAYVDSFRHALEKREIDPEQIRVQITDASSLEKILEAVASKNERQVDYALGMLESLEDPRIVGAVRGLVDHDSSEIRRKAVRVLTAQADDSLADRVAELLTDSDPRVRLEAVYYQCVHGGSEVETLRRHLDSEDTRLRAAALDCIAEYFGASGGELLDESAVREMAHREGPDQALLRRALARALGTARDEKLRHYLVELTEDRSPAVVRESIRSVGRVQHAEMLQRLVSLLGDRRYRKTARTSLRDFGDQAVAALAEALRAVDTPSNVRTNVPRVLGRMPSQASVNVLMSYLEAASPNGRFRALKALSKLRTVSDALDFDRRRVEAGIERELADADELLRLEAWAESHSTDAASSLLRKAISEKREENLERIFRLLGLIYPQQDIYNAFLGVKSDNQRVQASAIEFLDNLFDEPVSRSVLPLVERRLGPGGQPGVPAVADAKIFGALLAHPDAWLRACGIFSAGDHWDGTLAGAVDAARADPNPIVRETANMILERRGRPA